eukprot:TRINITY_DN8845_c0_g1_i1.p1 TRINITY_DN8845_c0_g1~~TRINITY_DN8845_c0_g1_i1.p1  ORF type:complete len:1151 (-),score=261.18 TRINITY_DN8845_c0_g1_i1:250-3702(-)
MPPANAYDKFSALLEVGDGLLARLYNIKHVYLPSSKDKLPIYTDAGYAKVVAAFTRKFPDAPSELEKVQGHELFVQRSKNIIDELDPIYFTFVDAMDFKDICLTLFNEFQTTANTFDLTENPHIFGSFMDLIVKFVQVHILLSTIADRKQVLSVYAKAHFYSKISEEPNYNKLGAYILEYEAPLKRMLVDFKNLSSKIGLGLLTIKDPLSKFLGVPEMRKDGLLSLITRPEQMKLPSHDQPLFDALSLQKYFIWIGWICLLIPEEFAVKEGALLNLLRTSLSQYYLLTVYKDEVFFVHQEYENLFSGYKSLNKALKLKNHKKLISESLAAVIGGTMPTRHKDRRVYLRQELTNILNLIQEYPGLLAPKIQLLLAALSMARDEVLWYYRHRAKTPPKSNAKHIREDEFRDERVIELIYLIKHVSDSIRQHADIIKSYYLQYLNTTDHTKLSDIVNQIQKDYHLNNTVTSTFTSLVQTLGSLPDDASQCDFKAWRRDWLRLEAMLSSTSTPLPLNQITHAVARLNLIYYHTQFVDNLEQLLSDCVTLKELNCFRDIVVEEYGKVVESGSVQGSHITTFFDLLNQLPQIATVYFPEEREQIGKDVVDIAQQYVNQISLKIGSLLTEISKQYIAFDAQVAPTQALYRAKEYKPDKNAVIVEPGSESEFKSRTAVEGLRTNIRTLSVLLQSLRSTFVVFSSEFTPLVAVRDMVIHHLKDFAFKLAQIPVVDKEFSLQIQRPSVIERQLSTYAYVLMTIENYVDLNAAHLIRKVLLHQYYNVAVNSTLGIELDQEPTWEPDTFLKPLTTWYVELVTIKMQNNSFTISPSRDSVVNNTSSSHIKPAEYASLSELRSLCNLIGPYGVKIIENELFRYIFKQVHALKDILTANKAALEEIAANYTKESASADTIKKMRDLDQFLQRSVYVGNALAFRGLLHQALREVTNDQIPIVYDTVKTLFAQYPNNVQMAQEYVGFDCLAREMGLPVGGAEQPLKSLLATTITTVDADLWALLPYAYAVGFTAPKVWGESVFRPLLETYSNNIHNLGLAIITLTSTLRAITTAEASEKDTADLMKKFLEVSSFVLVRQARNPKEVQARYKFASYPSAAVFLDRFVGLVHGLSRDVLENTFPYAIHRSMYRELYKPGKGQDAVEDAA